MEIVIEDTKKVGSKPATAPAEPPPAPTAEELKERSRLVSSKLFGKVAEEPAPPAEPPAAPEAPVIPETPSAPAASPEPEPEPTAPAGPTTLTAEAIRQAVKEGVESAQPTVEPTMAEEPALVVLPELSKEDLADYKALVYLAGKDAKLAGKPGEFLAWCQKAYAYQQQWEGANPDEGFSWESEEHAKWYEKNCPPLLDAEALQEARVDMRVDEKLKPERERQEREREERESAAALERAVPTIERRVNQQVVALVEGVDPELLKHLKDANGKVSLTDQTIQALEQADPVAKDVLDAMALELRPLVIELEKLAVDGLKHRLDPEHNPVHARIRQYHLRAERDILSAPTAEQQFDGKQFTSVADMRQMRETIRNSKGSQAERERKEAELDRTRCTLSIDDLSGLIVDDFARRAKATITKIDAVAKKKYGTNGGPPDPVRQEQPAQPAAPAAAIPAPAAAQPRTDRPPSSASADDLVTGRQPAPGAQKSIGEQVSERLFSR